MGSFGAAGNDVLVAGVGNVTGLQAPRATTPESEVGPTSAESLLWVLAAALVGGLGVGLYRFLRRRPGDDSAASPS